SLPADILKIDMQFVHKIVENPKSLAIVETIIELARRLGMKTTAEGVETEEQLRILNELGINYVQGFLLARPIPEEEISLLLI
ncbi:MAG TPA: EAL domain-containing protein, partial [Aquifex aeolicus]|nr:EAL domain-containing protein [Aquifex aeolicus]